MKNEFNWMAGGAQGGGVDTAANIFSFACGLGGYHVYGKREFHSNIKGKHSYFHLRVSPDKVVSNVNDVDMLAAFDAETLVRHMSELVPGGIIIVDEDVTKVDIFNIPTLPEEFKTEYSTFLDNQGLGDNLELILDRMQKNGVNLFKVPYGGILDVVSDKAGIDRIRADRMINVLTIGVSFSLLGYDMEIVEKAVRRSFAGKPEIADMNIIALEEADSYTKENFKGSFGHELEAFELDEERIFLRGYQAVALGKLLGGCGIQTYYPITPASDESKYIEAHEVFEANNEEGKGSVVVVQTEDEIAAINMANGAALTGARAATSTSGPGFSLMVEALGWAGANELPVVVTYYQRGAPSTGLPTRHAQEDLRFAIHAGHGEFSRVVIASGDIMECFYDSANSFNYAETYQIPVIHLIDKALSNSYQSYKIFNTRDLRVKRGNILDGTRINGAYKRFEFTESGISPRAFIGTNNVISWHTGNEHNEVGHVTEHPATRSRMVEKRMKKLELIEREVPIEEKINFFGESGAESMVVSWGSTKGAIREAVERLVKEGHSIGFIQVRMVHPLPTSYLSETLRMAEKIIDVEMNYTGQLGGLVTEKTSIPLRYQILKYNGRPFTTTETYHALKKVLHEKAPMRQVLSHGA